MERQHPRRAFTLLELLLLTAVIAVLAALLLPVLAKAKARSRQAQCASQLKQAGVALHQFAHDHENRFPAQAPVSAGGTLEFARTAQGGGAAVHWQALSNELTTPRLLACPADQRVAADHFATLRDINVSYFTGLSADFFKPDSILAGDRNFGFTWANANATFTWTRALHDERGNLLFADGRVEQLSSPGLRLSIGGTRPSSGSLALPEPAQPPTAPASAPAQARPVSALENAARILATADVDAFGVSSVDPYAHRSTDSAGPVRLSPRPRHAGGFANAPLPANAAESAGTPPKAAPITLSNAPVALARTPTTTGDIPLVSLAQPLLRDPARGMNWLLWLLLLLLVMIALEWTRRRRARRKRAATGRFP